MAHQTGANILASSSMTGETPLSPPPSSPWRRSRTPRLKRRRCDETHSAEEGTIPSSLSLPSSSRMTQPSARRTFLVALILTLSLGRTAAGVQPSQDTPTPQPPSVASQPLLSSVKGLRLNTERDSTHRLHPAKVHGTLQYSSISNDPDASTKATSIVSAPHSKNTSAAVFTFANSRHQYNSRITNSNGRGRGSDGSQSSASPSALSEQQPPNRLAFAYLEDMGLKNRLPFKSSMPRAGESWNEAGLRPNIDPRLPSIYRNDKGESRESGKSKDREEDALAEDEDVWGSEGRDKAQDWTQASQEGRQQYQQLQKGGAQDSIARPITKPIGKGPYGSIPPSQGLKGLQVDEAVVVGTVPTEAEDGAEVSDPDLLDSLSAVTDSVASGGTAGANSITPEVLRWSSLLINSGRMMLSWIKRAQKDEHGIALTMLMPKVSKPVIARRPWIPNDSKRDFVLLTIATIAVCGALCILWNSRVSPEEFERARRHKEYAADAAAKDAADIIYEEHEENLPTGLSSSSRPVPGYSRSRAGGSTMSRRPRAAGPEDTHGALQSEDSDGEYLQLTLDRRHGASVPPRGMRRGSLLGPTTSPVISISKTGNEGLFSSWLKPLYRWYGRRDSNAEVVLPLSSDLSRSSTPNPLLQTTAPGSDATLNAMGGGAGRRSRSNSITRKWKLQAPNLPRQQSSVNLLPASMDSRTSSSSSLQSLAQIVPFRSITPQPATSRQREREREKRRMTMLEVERRGSVASGTSGRSGYETLDRMENGKGDYVHDPQDDASGSSSASGSVSGDEPGMLRRPASFTTQGAWTEALPAVGAAGTVSSLPAPSSSSSSSASRTQHPPTANGHAAVRLAPPMSTIDSSPRIGSGESTPRASDLQRESGSASGSGSSSATSGNTYFAASHANVHGLGLGRGYRSTADDAQQEGSEAGAVAKSEKGSHPAIPRVAIDGDPLHASLKLSEAEEETSRGKGKERQLDRP
ncbi:hypothetical protein BCV69DRAFT_313318 [Microstroma glucosiphilum]|uniref:Uncharacterized protein n=1 Tax=Pseudomicrostroma glucosiphilum TaxID=1684307 RepID=A0A316U700_9BASI|nr:hypothetical protein BCV69DRAFT_313318 [Pseudomicrostroma glucosiphilum]PWN20123.1 hypothetical protein BCV69DRAFT_313318 [Pseudomicrostroma glucosiphilum]